MNNIDLVFVFFFPHLCFLFYPIRFDDYVNLVLADAIEYSYEGGQLVKTSLSEILLNGNHIAVIVPGGTGPEN